MAKGNQAPVDNPFTVNDRTVDIHITVRGSDWYYAAMSVFGTTMCIIIGLSLIRPRTHRVFFHIWAAAALCAMVEYYSMASNLGWVPIDVEWRRTEGIVAGVNRQIWWVRYCGWFLIWPLISLALCFTAVAPTANTIWTCFLSAVMAIMAEVGALVKSDFKWGYYGFWVFFWLLLVFNLGFTVRNYAAALGPDVHGVYTYSTLWVLLLWMLYPICWGCGEGGNVIAPDSEFIWYGILDVLLIAVTPAFFLWQHWRIDPARLGLLMRDYNDPISGLQSSRYEKQGEGEAAGGVTNGATGEAPATA